MRRIIAVAAIVVVTVASHVGTVVARGPSSHGLGGSVGGMHSAFYHGSGWGTNHSWWYPGHGYGYGWGSYYPYTVQTPVLVNPPVQVFSGGLITITNPADSKTTLSYTLNGVQYTIPPGYSQELRADRLWVIQFSRGSNLGDVRYQLEPGLYTFSGTDHGWELFHGVREPGPMIAAPSAPAAPSVGHKSPVNPPTMR